MGASLSFPMSKCRVFHIGVTRITDGVVGVLRDR